MNRENASLRFHEHFQLFNKKYRVGVQENSSVFFLYSSIASWKGGSAHLDNLHSGLATWQEESAWVTNRGAHPRRTSSNCIQQEQDVRCSFFHVSSQSRPGFGLSHGYPEGRHLQPTWAVLAYMCTYTLITVPTTYKIKFPRAEWSLIRSSRTSL